MSGWVSLETRARPSSSCFSAHVLCRVTINMRFHIFFSINSNPSVLCGWQVSMCCLSSKKIYYLSVDVLSPRSTFSCCPVAKFVTVLSGSDKTAPSLLFSSRRPATSIGNRSVKRAKPATARRARIAAAKREAVALSCNYGRFTRFTLRLKAALLLVEEEVPWN